MTNELFFIFHTLTTIALCLFALKLGKSALISTFCLLGVLSNLFIAKQISLFGLNVTCGDVYAVGSILCLNLIQEFFGKTGILKIIFTSFFIIALFLIMSQFHILYTPSLYDMAHPHYNFILALMPRITIASIATYFTVQLLDVYIFNLLKTLLFGKFFALRAMMSLVFSQTLDTILFSYLGLYGIVNSIWHVIIVSLTIKLCIIALSAPIISFTKILINKK